MKTAAFEPSPSPEPLQWSSAIGHASTGKSGRVIERLQQEIDRLHRDKQLLRLRHEEAERAAETLNTRNQFLQDRNSNYESSHEANLRQLQRKERQVEDLREQLQKEKSKTARAEEAMRTATMNEDEWREQANQARAIAQQKEAEYNTIASCRTMDNERHQNGLDNVRGRLKSLIRQREDDLEKQKRMEIIAEQQKKTIEQLEELTKRLTNNFRLYRTEIDSAIEGLRDAASANDERVNYKVEEMKKAAGEMRWLMNVETVVNGRQMPERLSTNYEVNSDAQSFDTAKESTKVSEPSIKDFPKPSSPTKRMSLDFRRHKRKGSKPGK